VFAGFFITHILTLPYAKKPVFKLKYRKIN